MLKPDLKNIQSQYDEYMEEKTLRHLRLKRELEDRLAREDFEGLKPIIEQAHQLFRDKKASKMELREALRQYGNPKFKEMWELIPFEKTSVDVPTYRIGESENTITFFRTGWNWTGIPLEVEELTFPIHTSENTGTRVIYFQETQEDHVMFSFHNGIDANKELNK